MTTLPITRATLEDLPAVVDLCMMVEAQHEAYSPFRFKTKPNIREGYLRWMTREIQADNMLIAVAKDPASPAPPQIPLAQFHPTQIATFAGSAPNPTHVAGIIIVRSENEIPIYTYTTFAFILDLAVATDYRRRGLATRLLHHARDWSAAQGYHHLRLNVAEGNPEARAAFERAGFLSTYHEMILPLSAPSA